MIRLIERDAEEAVADCIMRRQWLRAGEAVQRITLTHGEYDELMTDVRVMHWFSTPLGMRVEKVYGVPICCEGDSDDGKHYDVSRRHTHPLPNLHQNYYSRPDYQRAANSVVNATALSAALAIGLSILADD